MEQELLRVESEAAGIRAELADAKRLTEELTAELRERRRELRQWDTDKSKLLVAIQRIKVFCTILLSQMTRLISHQTVLILIYLSFTMCSKFVLCYSLSLYF